LSIRTKLVMLFSALVAVPLVAAIAWLGITAHRSVLDAGRALTGVADASLQQSARDVARLTEENAARSGAELVAIGHRSLTGFAQQEIHESEQALRHSADRLTRTGSGLMQRATARIAGASSSAVNDANTQLRRHQRRAIDAVSQALIHSSRRAFDSIGRDLTAQSEQMVVRLAIDLNLERSRRTADLVQNFLQNQIDALNQAAQEPQLVNPNAAVATRLLRQLVEKHHAALLQAELRNEQGDVTAQWPPPLASPPPEAAALPEVAARALKTGRVEHSSVQFEPPGTPPVMALATALRGRRVLVATLSLEMLSHLLAQHVLGDGRAAPVFVMTRDGQVLAHSEPANVGTSLSLAVPRLARVQHIDAETVMYESPGSGPQRRITHLTQIRGTEGWVVVAVQPLSDLLAKTEELRRSVHTTAEAAANEMAQEANAHAARLEAAAVPEQRRVAAETARRVRGENQDVSRQAVAALVRQQDASAHRDIERVKRDSEDASRAAAVAMTRTAQGIASTSGDRIRSDAALRARLGLASMHELASQTAAAAGERIIFESGGVLLVALMAALLVALLTAQSAVRPITALAAGARSIAQGDFSHRVPNTSEDELGQLAASFNRMAASIEASRAELQANNAVLAQEKRRIQAIVDNSPDGLLILNEDGSVGYANPAARSLLPWQGPAHGNGSVPLQAVLSPSLLGSLDDCLEAIDAGRAAVCDLALDAPRRRAEPAPRRGAAPAWVAWSISTT
jgi:HAMP domain-containing protein